MTRRAYPSVPRTLNDPSDNSRRKGEPVVTAIWMTVSAVTLVLGLSFPALGAVDSPLQTYVVPTVALLYALAMTGTCAYNRIRYGHVWVNPLPPARSRRIRRRRRRHSATARRVEVPLVMIG